VSDPRGGWGWLPADFIFFYFLIFFLGSHNPPPSPPIIASPPPSTTTASWRKIKIIKFHNQKMITSKYGLNLTHILSFFQINKKKTSGKYRNQIDAVWQLCHDTTCPVKLFISTPFNLHLFSMTLFSIFHTNF
jgi:hypothetical protein